ncbi:MAG: amino acid adenylation domain-containing protein [Candidatus Eisenbacteria bacterium]|nr:amino acid adenylation domain-containing protein [Candidatus Eisenbacteria bacterium]
MDAARRAPDAAAVRFEEETLSYGELDRLSDRLAHALAAHDVRRGDRVAIYLPKSTASLIAIHGILKAGGVYVPLDPGAPVQRLAYILEDCGVRCVVAASAKAAAIRTMVEGGARVRTAVFTDDGGDAGLGDLGIQTVPWARVLGGAEVGPPVIASIATDLAYILYTSGSTGTPKGVMISHLNSLTCVHWAAAEFGVTKADRLSSHAPFHFDLSILDLFVAMKAGASVALVPDGTSTFPIRLGQWIEKNQITIWYSVPSILTLLLLKGRLDRLDLSSLRHVLFAGEVFPNKYLAAAMRAVPHAEFVNLYGPTETNVITFYRVPAARGEQGEPIPIGRPCANGDVFVVGEDGKVVTEPGVTGELFARGTTVALGYWGDPEKTARGFLQNPHQMDFAERVYRTGDIVSLGTDGNYRLLGRRDRMIKSRGYRIELDEIEIILNAHPSIREAAVVAVPDELSGNRILAFVAGTDGRELNAGFLRDYCLERLPRYMVPESFNLLDELPKTSTGKIDRARLARG